jgi:hypothetical protein
VPRTVQKGRQGTNVVGAEDGIHPRSLFQDGFAVLLRQAAADGNLHPGVGGLDRRQLAQVSVQLVVRVFPDGARVEHHDVGLGAVRRNVARRFEHPRHALGIMNVHLASESTHLVGAGGAGSVGGCG